MQIIHSKKLKTSYFASFEKLDELFIKFKKGKSESMLFCTRKKLSSTDSIKLEYDYYLHLLHSGVQVFGNDS